MGRLSWNTPDISILMRLYICLNLLKWLGALKGGWMSRALPAISSPYLNPLLTQVRPLFGVGGGGVW